MTLAKIKVGIETWVSARFHSQHRLFLCTQFQNFDIRLKLFQNGHNVELSKLISTISYTLTVRCHIVENIFIEWIFLILVRQAPYS